MRRIGRPPPEGVVRGAIGPEGFRIRRGGDRWNGATALRLGGVELLPEAALLNERPDSGATRAPVPAD